jgi:hypothetical protein
LKNFAQSRLRNAWNGKRMVAVLQLALVLFVLAMTQFKSLHRACHPDSTKPDHQCVVTVFQSGQVDAPNCEAAIVPAATSPTALVVVESVFVPTVDYSLPPSCGPPAFLS